MPLPTPTPDQAAAHDFLVELRTRVTTQPLPYQYGVDARALESMFEIFGLARASMKKHPGCEQFAAMATHQLNLVLRPLTAKWHRAHKEGRLDSRDGADEFRGDLEQVQRELRKFAAELHKLAYGESHADALVQPVMSPEELAACFTDLPFGIAPGKGRPPAEIRAAINQAELAEVTRRRAAHGLPTAEGKNAVGLAFSGGGIRSATFCLGVAQVLAERDLLKHVDYLSTVSGGGYTGSFLSVRLGREGGSSADVAGPHGPDPDPIRYLRQHAKFLTPINLKDAWTFVMDILAGMFLNWSVPLLLVVLAGLMFPPGVPATTWRTLMLAALGGVAVALIAYGRLLRGTKRMRVVGGWTLGIATALACLVGAAWLIDAGYHFYTNFRGIPASVSPKIFKELAAIGGSGAVAGILHFLIDAFPATRKSKMRMIAKKILLQLAGALLPLLAIWLFYVCRSIGTISGDPSASWLNLAHYSGDGILLLAAAVLAFVALFVLNINLTSPHRIYRDRLATAFIHTGGGKQEPVELTRLNPSGRAPYHLINTTVNLPSSEQPALRDRKCGFFLFSKHWIGSSTTGFHPTEKWNANCAPVDLATAMATSGAAASAYMGLQSMPTLAALLAFLNIRTGLWIRQPGRSSSFAAPGFVCLLREMLGVNMSENSNWLNLSDGGHIENLAVYELLRRRCKFILCVDGESDPQFRFEGLLTLVRHAQIDYGIEIRPDLSELRPKPETGNCQAHGLLCRIKYPDTDAIGLLLYLKLSVTGNESELIKRYRTLHPEFPHQSTADQFFDEEQFEAYRQLGVHAAESMFSRSLTHGHTRPASFADWYRQLATNLLVP